MAVNVCTAGPILSSLECLEMKLSAILVSCRIEFSHKQQKENNCKCHFLLATLINGRMIKYRIDTHKVTSSCHGVSSRYHDI